MMEVDHKVFLLQAVKMAQENKAMGGRPFAAVLVKDGKILASGVNQMLQTNDATSHAELEVIRIATQKQGETSLDGSTIYASGHPCPMCLAAILMTNIKSVFYAFDNDDAEPYGLSSESTYKKLGIIKAQVPIRLTKLDVAIPVNDVYQ